MKVNNDYMLVLDHKNVPCVFFFCCMHVIVYGMDDGCGMCLEDKTKEA